MDFLCQRTRLPAVSLPLSESAPQPLVLQPLLEASRSSAMSTQPVVLCSSQILHLVFLFSSFPSSYFFLESHYFSTILSKVACIPSAVYKGSDLSRCPDFSLTIIVAFPSWAHVWNLIYMSWEMGITTPWGLGFCWTLIATTNIYWMPTM